MTKQAKQQMARDLQIQAFERQRRLQIERDQDYEFSKKLKKEDTDYERNEHRRTKSMVDKNMKNQTELLKQLKIESVRKQSEWGREKV